MTKTVRYGDAILAYHVYGSSIPLVSLHGFGDTNSIWKRQTEYLGSYCLLIIPDLPGFGESELLRTNGKNLEMELLADCIFSLINNENIKKCIMLGHSMGGYVTSSFAKKYPGKLIAFGFVHSTAFADTDTKKQDRARGIEAINLTGSYAFLKKMIPGLFADEFEKKNPALVDALIEDGKHFSKTNL